MFKSLILAALLGGSAAVCSTAAFSADDPTPRQVYQAAEAGHIVQAEQMLDQVLKDHPRSGEAHYAAAQVYAKAGDFSRARTELAIADRLEPGLPFAPSGAVSTLRRELSAARAPQASSPAFSPAERSRSGLPWGGILLVLIGIGLVWMLIRRRIQTNSYPTYTGSVPPGPGAPGYGAPGMGAGPYYPGGGGGGLMGSLGTGLAVGAGVAVGEELVHHVLDGNRSEGIIGSANADEAERLPPPNNDNMGGQDFGINDSNSWDDTSGGGDGGSFDSGGGDSWT
jgi:hypothetical protein